MNVYRRMSMTITRTIHPIGQGAFYTELLESDGTKFTVVYDCGCEVVPNISHRAEAIVEDWLGSDTESSEKVIDILFISHFHNDHINGVKLLIPHTKVVVMPFIENSIKVELKSLASKLSGTGIPISFDIIDPYDFSYTKFLYVVSEKDNGKHQYPVLNSPEKPQSPENFGDGMGQFQDIFDESKYINNVAYLKSGDLIRSYDWFYMPFTRELPTGDKKLQETVKNLNAYIGGLTGNWFEDGVLRSKVKNKYNKIDSSLNNTSMLMFSSPVAICECNDEETLPSCLYTGDIQLSKEITMLINKRISLYSIGTLQVPHHGSKENWVYFNNSTNGKINNLANDTRCFCSHGLHNRFKHPNQLVLDDFKTAGKFLYGVNENPSTKINHFYNIPSAFAGIGIGATIPHSRIKGCLLRFCFDAKNRWYTGNRLLFNVGNTVGSDMRFTKDYPPKTRISLTFQDASGKTVCQGEASFICNHHVNILKHLKNDYAKTFGTSINRRFIFCEMQKATGSTLAEWVAKEL